MERFLFKTQKVKILNDNRHLKEVYSFVVAENLLGKEDYTTNEIENCIFELQC